MADENRGIEGCTAIANVFQKGGTGKTFSSTNEAGGFAARGYDVLLVDMDPQGSLTANLGLREVFSDAAQTSLDEILLQEQTWAQVGEIIHELPEFDFIPANKTYTGNRSPIDSSSNSDERTKIAFENHLADQYDVIIFDTPPSFDAYTKNAIMASRQIVVPVKPEYEMIHSTKLLREMVTSFEAVHQTEVTYLAFLMTKVDYSSMSKQDEQMVNWFHNTFGEKGYEIRKRAAFARSKYAELRDKPGHSIYTYPEARQSDQFKVWDKFIADIQERSMGIRERIRPKDDGDVNSGVVSEG